MNVAWFKNPDHVAYCKEEEILTKLSHTITVTSEVGKGTAVKLCLDTVSLGVE